MSIYLPVAEISTNTFHLLALGLASGFASGLYGIGGGIITTPMLIFYGIPSPIAVGTSALMLLGTSISGTMGNMMNHRIDFRIGTIMALGSYAGSTAGLGFMGMLTKNKNEDLVISVVFICVMAVVALPMYLEIAKKALVFVLEQKQQSQQQQKPDGRKRSRVFAMHPNTSQTYSSAIFALMLGFFVGTISAMIGIGGGALLVPIMSYFLKIPLNIAIATSLFQIVPTSLNTLCQQVGKSNVDLVLGIAMLSTSSISVHIGSFVSKKLNPLFIKTTLSSILTLILVMFLKRMFSTPSNVFVLY